LTLKHSICESIFLSGLWQFPFLALFSDHKQHKKW